MDSVDLRILKIYQDTPEISVADLAKQVGLSHTPCWRRLKQLESSGAIERRAVILNQKLLGLGISVLAHVKLKTHDEETLEALEKEVCVHDQIVDCFSMSGESDYVFRVVAKDIEHYERFLKKVLVHLPGVASVNSHFVLKSVKQTTKLPL